MSTATQAAIDDLKAQVTGIASAVSATVATLHTLADKLHESADDPVEIKAQADAIKTLATALTAAVAGTDAPPAPPAVSGSANEV